jgi:uncharacterized protein YcaQ
MTVHRLSRTEARRIAVGAQCLDAPRPDDLVDVVRRLGALQVDLTAAVAPSADLVAWSRLGGAYALGDLDDAVAAQTLVEFQGMIRPAEDLALFRADMAEWPGRGDVGRWRQGRADWVAANPDGRRDILAALRSDGPLAAVELPDSCDVPWRSTGWNNNRNVAMMLTMLEERGEVAVAGRRGKDRLWDLAARVHPDGPAVPSDEARRQRGERRLRSLGLARSAAVTAAGDPPVGDAAVVEGVTGRWRVDPARLGQPFTGRTALLSPLDRLVFDRKRMTDLFAFDYQLEMYKPAARRRFGYWALPILHDDRLVGKLDATADHATGRLYVDAVHEDEPFPPEVAAAVGAEIDALGRWLGLAVARTGG